MVTVSGVPSGNRLAAFTCSGGDVAMLADSAEGTGVEFPEPSAAAQSDLTRLLPEIATISNPLDYTTPLWGQETALNKVFRSMLKDGFDAALLVQDYPPQALDDDRPMYLADARAFIKGHPRRRHTGGDLQQRARKYGCRRTTVSSGAGGCTVAGGR